MVKDEVILILMYAQKLINTKKNIYMETGKEILNVFNDNVLEK